MKKLIFKLMMVSTCLSIVAEEAVAQERSERSERERGERRERPERPDGERSQRNRQRPGSNESDRSSRRRPQTSQRGEERRGFGGGPGVSGGFMRMFPVMVVLDKDGNGEISESEIKGAVAALKKLDKNKDGKLTEDELRPSFGNRGGSGAGRQNRDGQEGRPSFQGGNRPSTRGEGGQSNRRRSRSNGEGQERRPR